RPVAGEVCGWGGAGTGHAADDADIRRKLTEAGRRLKALMDDDGSGSDVAEADESPQLAYAAPDEPEEPARAAADEADFGNIALTSARTRSAVNFRRAARKGAPVRSEEHTSELQSRENLVCRLLLEKKKRKKS